MGLNKQFLATTGISEMWDLSSENILFLGPWCLLDRENRKLVKDRHYSVVSSPWLFPGKIKDAAEYTQHIYNETLPVISERLNQLHGVSYPNQYWQILLGPWLLHFIEVLYERYSRIQNALDLFPNFYTHVLPDKIC